MKTLLVVYVSFTGGARQMAEAAAEGARGEEGVQVRLLQAPQAGPEDLLAADGYVFAGPEMLGSMAGLLKDLFDRCYYPLLERVQGPPTPRWSAPAVTGRARRGRSSASPPAGGSRRWRRR